MIAQGIVVNENDIVKLFAVDHGAAETLLSQLKRRFSEFIQNSSVGTRIPSERKLAEVLKVSRVTVRNAMRDFFESGAIIQNGRRGTYVFQKPSVIIPDDIHPMAIDGGMPARTCVLKLLLYENIPFQKVFWESAVADFNRSYSGAQVEISWLQRDISGHNMNSYVMKNHFDVVQANITHNIQEITLETSMEMRTTLQSSDFYLDLYYGDTNSLLKSVIPIHQVASMTFWNGNLADKIGFRDIRARLRKGGLLDLLDEAARLLPDGALASGHAWDIPALRGVPRDCDVENLEKYVCGEFERFAPYVGRSNMFMTRQKSPFDMQAKFIAGELLFINTMPTNLFLFGSKMNFDLKVAPFHVPLNNKSMGSAMGLFVPRNSSHPDIAFDFIDFMLSEETQGKMAEMKWVVPFRRSSLSRLAKRMDCGLDVLGEAVESSRVELSTDGMMSRYLRMMVFETREEFVDILNGNRSSKECAATFMEKFNCNS